MRSFFRAFLYAGQGIAAAVKTQRNLRFHMAAAVYVTADGMPSFLLLNL